MGLQDLIRDRQMRMEERKRKEQYKENKDNLQKEWGYILLNLHKITHKYTDDECDLYKFEYRDKSFYAIYSDLRQELMNDDEKCFKLTKQILIQNQYLIRKTIELLNDLKQGEEMYFKEFLL